MREPLTRGEKIGALVSLVCVALSSVYLIQHIAGYILAGNYIQCVAFLVFWTIWALLAVFVFAPLIRIVARAASAWLRK